MLTWQQTTDNTGVSLPVTTAGAASAHTLATSGGSRASYRWSCRCALEAQGSTLLRLGARRGRRRVPERTA